MARSSSVLHLTTVAQLRALGAPVRRDIIEVLIHTGASSVRQLAEHMEVAPSALYYHLELLMKAGLVVAEQRPGRTKPETIYRFAEDTIRIDPKNQARPFVTALAKVYETFLRLASRHMVAALASRKTVRAGPMQDLRVRQHNLLLTPERLRELNRRIDDLEAWVLENAICSTGHRRISLTLAMSDVEAGK